MFRGTINSTCNHYQEHACVFQEGPGSFWILGSPLVRVCLICHATALLRATLWKARKWGALGGSPAGLKLACEWQAAPVLRVSPRCLLNESFHTNLLASRDWSTDGAPTRTGPIRALPWSPGPARAYVCSSCRKLGREEEADNAENHEDQRGDQICCASLRTEQPYG